jgi:Arc/MetJ-type ribon-helix-helix transcriptional regulator
MMIGMTAQKIAVSIPGAILEQARRSVRKGRAASMSAYVTSAIAEKVKNDDLAELLEQMLAETGGPLTAKERAEADKALFGRKRKVAGR